MERARTRQPKEKGREEIKKEMRRDGGKEWGPKRGVVSFGHSNLT